MMDKPFKSLKGDDKKYRAKEGADIMRRHTELMSDPDWMEAAKAMMEEEMKMMEKAIMAYGEMDKK